MTSYASLTTFDAHSQHIMERTHLIKFYFHLGMSYSEILTTLASKHGNVISRNYLRDNYRVWGRCMGMDGCLRSAKKMALKQKRKK